MTKQKFRKIIVDNQNFNWFFNDIIKIWPEKNPQNKLEIDFGYFDSWLYVNDKENEPEDYEPKIVTPAFIRICIENAIALGWEVNLKHNSLKLKYRNETFTIVNYSK